MMKPTDEQLNDLAYWESQAPNQAECYDHELNLWLKRDVFSEWLVWRPEERRWSQASIIVDWHVRAAHSIKRPTKPAAPEWDGEGLPPVGCECEAEYDICKAEWYRVYIIGKDGKSIIGRWREGPKVGELLDYITPAAFRPIRTKEQRERDELQEIISDAYESGVAVIAEDILSRYNLEPKQ